MGLRDCLRFGLALACVVVFDGCKRSEAPKALPPPEVLVAAATLRDLPVYREWIGTLEGSENAQIRAHVSGYILRRDYQEGALVKKGDVLFEIDPRPFAAALDEARGQLAQAQATQIASQAEFERSKSLFAQKVISEKEYINKTQLNVANVEKIKALEANVEQARLNLEFCKITSPIDGLVGIAQAQIGDLVGTASNSVLTSVSTLDPIKMIFPVSEVDYLAASQRVQDSLAKPLKERPESIELVLANGKTFPCKGRLLSVDLQAKGSTGTILVTALAENPGSVLRPGFFARARMVTEVLKNAVVVPQAAVAEVQGSYQVGVIDPNGKAEIRPVKVGPRAGTDWAIASGLQAGEKVVVEGLQRIKAGTPVKALPWTPAAEESATPAEKAEAK